MNRKRFRAAISWRPRGAGQASFAVECPAIAVVGHSHRDRRVVEMDISKLPKFSQTRPGEAPEPVMETSAPPPDPDRPPVPAYASPASAADEGARRRAEPSLDDELDRGDAMVQIWI